MSDSVPECVPQNCRGRWIQRVFQCEGGGDPLPSCGEGGGVYSTPIKIEVPKDDHVGHVPRSDEIERQTR